jgi:hypothetical protein
MSKVYVEVMCISYMYKSYKKFFPQVIRKSYAYSFVTFQKRKVVDFFCQKWKIFQKRKAVEVFFCQKWKVAGLFDHSGEHSLFCETEWDGKGKDMH